MKTYKRPYDHNEEKASIAGSSAQAADNAKLTGKVSGPGARSFAEIAGRPRGDGLCDGTKRANSKGAQ